MAEAVAWVENREITRDDLDRMEQAFKQQNKKESVTEEERNMLLENLIENSLLQEESIHRNLSVTDEMVERQMEQLYAQYGGKEKVVEMLADSDVTVDTIAENMRRDMSGQLTAEDEVQQKLSLTEDDLHAFYEQNKERMKSGEALRAQHILISSDTERPRETAEEIHGKIDAGASFDEMAQEHSDCPSGKKGGDLEWFGTGQMVPAFEKAVLDLSIGEVSAPVETPFGYHIIKKTDHRPSKDLSFEEAKDQIKEFLTRQKSQEIIAELIKELRKKYTVTYA
ncbi:peptidylprolyl isomerase [Chitinivibrio alkaliphilus]|uniref:peptidylprolyl isomerase n=1 Tax=Chitinivibrio alkaliphilus ACht1 TaxID=1313304 RepID=U7DAU7_9BACT|nr:peptidylprolyl isomerase [Chitinivibrio alkaliphilus]ERP31525.1 PPIC-type PPIASE domain-containing protein [Chitinivibrio alkaliphilus ACht1]